MHEAKDVIMWIEATKVMIYKMVYKISLFLFSHFPRLFILFLKFDSKRGQTDNLPCSPL